VVDDLEVVYDFVGLFACVGADDEFGRAVPDAVGQLVRGEASEDNNVGGADPCAGQYGHQTFNGHGHVDDDPVSGLYFELGFECACEELDALVKLCVGDL
jgi:hypothetical protein